MESLSTELLHAILYEIWLWHRQDLLQAILVCRTWHSIVQTILEHSIDNLILAPLTKTRNETLFQRIETDTLFQRRLRRIRILDVHASGHIPVNRTGPGWEFNFGGRGQNEYGYLEEESAETWNEILRLANLISRLNLGTFSWKAKPNIPAPIINALARKKDCRVEIESRADDPEEHYNCRFTYESILNRQGLSGLHSIAQNLRVLEVVVPAPWFFTSSGSEHLDLLGRLVRKSCSLRKLGIHAAGRIYAWSRFRDGATKNAFQTVRDFGWLFNHTDSAARKQLNLQALRLTNFCLCRADENCIRSMRDLLRWRALRSAHFTCPVFIQIAAEQDVQLRSLSLHFDNPDDGVRSCVDDPDIDQLRVFLASQKELQELEIYNEGQVFDPLDDDTEDSMGLFESLGNSLYELVVHHNESEDIPGRTRPLLSQTVLQHMGEKFQHLTRLAIDLPPEDDMMFEYLTTISKAFPFLSELELSLELEKQHQRLTRTPVSKHFCRQIWEKYRSGRHPDLRIPGPQRITVSVGAMSASERHPDMHASLIHRHRQYVMEVRQPTVESVLNDHVQRSPVIKMVELEEFNERLCLDHNARYGGVCKESFVPDMERLMEEGVVWSEPGIQEYMICMFPR